MRSRGLSDPANPRPSAAQGVPQANVSPRPATDPVEESADDVLSDRQPAYSALARQCHNSSLILQTPTTKTMARTNTPGRHLFVIARPTRKRSSSPRALRKAGIDSWIQQASEFGRRDARVHGRRRSARSGARHRRTNKVRRRSLKRKRRKRRSLSNPSVLSADRMTWFLKASTPKTPGAASNAMSNGPKPRPSRKVKPRKQLKTRSKRKEPPGNGAALSLRENSSNGGKPDRTFWLHSRFGGKQCQGKICVKISSFYFQ